MRARIPAFTAMAVAFVPAGEYASAEVLGAAANGFEVRESVACRRGTRQGVRGAASARALVGFRSHIFGSAANLSLEARAGGCWCERLADGGSVEHLRVLLVSPGRMLRMRGALGPFQGLAVDGV